MSHLPPIAVRAAAPEILPRPEVDGLEWRPIRREDVPAWTALVSRILEADGMEYRMAQDEAAEYFAMPAVDMQTDSLLARDGDGVPRAWSLVCSYEGDETLVRAVVDGGVDPAWRRRGVGRQLVSWGTGRARQVLAASGKEAPGRICAYLDDRLTVAGALYREAGYAPLRYYAELRRRLDDSVHDTQVPEGLRIEPWPEEDEEVRLAHNAAFADHWGSQPRSAEDWRTGRANFSPGWSFVAREEATGRVVGYVRTDRYEEDWPVAGYSSGYVALLGTLREWRGRGVGTALLATTMHAQRAEGIEYAEIGVDTANPSGAHGLYASLGFEAFTSSTMLAVEV